MLKIGQVVALVGTDGFMPPIGAVGEVVGWDDGDYEVAFADHPCPVPPGETWFAAPAWLVPLDGTLLDEEAQQECMA